MLKLQYQNNDSGSADNTIRNLPKTLTMKELNVMDTPELSKVCPVCKSVFYKPKRVGANTWNNRVFCSKSCATKNRYQTNFENKNCPYCGIGMKPRGKQAPYSFNNQKYCSRSCASKATKNGAFLPKEKHWKWNGGKTIDSNGYKKIRISKNKYKHEHIIIAEKIIGRGMFKNEVVHHKNGIITDNRPENLKVMINKDHSRFHNTGKKRTEEVKEKLKKIRKGTNQKEHHQQWKPNITEIEIKKAISMFKYKKQAASFLGINPDTLRARINYYKRQEICDA